MRCTELKQKLSSGNLSPGAWSLVSNTSTEISAACNFRTTAAEWISSTALHPMLCLQRGSSLPVGSAELLAIKMLCFNEWRSQIAHLEISSQALEFISKLIGDPSFKHKFGNWFCYFGSCPHNTFYSFLS